MRASIRLWWSIIERQSTARSGWSQNKKFTPAAPAQGSVTGKNPNRGKTGTINSQLLAQAACRNLDKLKTTECTDFRKEESGWVGGKLITQCSKTEDGPQ